MGQYQSQLGQFGFKKQAAVGSPATLGAAAPSRWMKLRKSGLAADRSLLIPDPEIAGAGGRDVPKPYLGAATFSGDVEFYVRSEALPLALFGAFGGGAGAPTGSGTAGYVHTITPADTLPVFTIQEELGNAFDTFVYTDAAFNTLHLEAAANGYLMGTLGVLALGQTDGATPQASPGFDATPLYVSSNIGVTLGGVSVPASSFALDLNNNIEGDHFVLGSLTADALTPKRRELTGNFVLRPQSNAMFKQAVYGDPSATSVGGNVTVAQMVITCTTYEIITGATSQVYTTAITIPEVVLKPFKVEANGDDVIEHSIDWQATKIAASNIATVVVTNGVSTAYSA